MLVVGAGVAGLQTARALLKSGFKVTVLEEQEDVGGVSKAPAAAGWAPGCLPGDLVQQLNYVLAHTLKITEKIPQNTGLGLLSPVCPPR